MDVSTEGLQTGRSVRGQLNRAAVIGSLLFTLCCCAVMAVYKWNEAYLDTYSSTIWHGQTVENVETSTTARHSLEIKMTDAANGQLVLPLAQPVSQANITVREEFTQHKLVITMVGAAPCVESGSEVITDATLMDAVGIYRQQENIVVEIYEKAAYAYQLTCTAEALTVDFTNVADAYDIVSVVYLPESDREWLSTQDTQSLTKLAQKYNMKIYTAYTMQDDYTQAEVAAFANEVCADLLIGFEIEEADEAQLVTWCNSEYFIPDFGSVELAAVVTDTLLHSCEIDSVEVAAADESCPLVSQAKVPSVLAHLATPQTRQSLEYDLGKQLMSALTSMLEQAVTTYYE